MSLDMKAVRKQFPSLEHFISYSDTLRQYADNAGGSQTLATVANSILDYLLTSNVQLGASYSKSKQSSALTEAGKSKAAELIGAESKNSVIFGPSSTQLLFNLSCAFEESLNDGDEIVLSVEHETNVGAWVRMVEKLAARGVTIKISYWSISGSISDSNVERSIDTLSPLITPRTKLVAFSACSNVLGGITDIKKVVDMVKQKSQGNSKTCVDCVAYAPHRRMEVETWGVDFMIFSIYKVYGAHCSVLYVSPSALISLTSLAHSFLNLSASDPYKIGLAGGSYELVAGVVPVVEYLISLSGLPLIINDRLTESFTRIAKQEKILLEKLMGFLTSSEMKKRGIRIVGTTSVEESLRVPTVSFVVQGQKSMKSHSVVDALDEMGNIGIRFGNFYAFRLMKALGLHLDDGVVRISLVHYNTVEEVDSIIESLKQILV